MTVRRRIMPDPPPGWASWEELMDLALEEAARAEEAGEVPVGAVLVAADGRLLGRGHNSPVQSRDPSAHAEIAALRQGALACGNYRLAGATLLVTLEPCLMCVGAMVHARINGLVFGAADPAAGAVVSCLEGLELPYLNHRVWFAGGICQEACAAMLHDFFRTRRTGGREFR